MLHREVVVLLVGLIIKRRGGQRFDDESAPKKQQSWKPMAFMEPSPSRPWFSTFGVD
jgi:hypothetical protein